MARKFEYIGELPPGDWKFCLVAIYGKADVVMIVDMSGKEMPRMVADGKLVVPAVE